MQNPENFTKLNGSNPAENVENKLEALQGKAIKAFDESKKITSDAVEKSVDFAKKYPVHTTLGAGAIGLAAGVLIGKLTK